MRARDGLPSIVPQASCEGRGGVPAAGPDGEPGHSVRPVGRPPPIICWQEYVQLTDNICLFMGRTFGATRRTEGLYLRTRSLSPAYLRAGAVCSFCGLQFLQMRLRSLQFLLSAPAKNTPVAEPPTA